MQKEDRKVIIWITTAIIFLAIVIFVLSQFVNEEKNVDDLMIPAQYTVVSENVKYYQDSEGYLARPDEAGNYPGVMMIHEWWGLNDNIRQMADNLASQGYTVLAVDLYNGEVAETADEARVLATNVRENQDEAIANLNAGVNFLKNNEGSERIASLGWCFGGGQSLQVSLNNDEIDATIIYYGNLVTNESELMELEGPVLGIFGEEDSSIPVTSVNSFDSALDNLGIKNEIHIYPGVGHAFANPSGNNYAPEETMDAWVKTLTFLEENLKSN